MSVDPGLQTTATSLRRGTLRLARRLRAERPRHGGVSLLRLGLLAHLAREGAMSPGELATAEHVQPQSLTRTLTSLEREGLLTRRTDARDQRRAVLEITQDGRTALEADMRLRDVWLAGVIADELTPTERELLRLAGQLMQRLADAAQRPPAS